MTKDELIAWFSWLKYTKTQDELINSLEFHLKPRESYEHWVSIHVGREHKLAAKMHDTDPKSFLHFCQKVSPHWQNQDAANPNG